MIASDQAQGLLEVGPYFWLGCSTCRREFTATISTARQFWLQKHDHDTRCAGQMVLELRYRDVAASQWVPR